MSTTTVPTTYTYLGTVAPILTTENRLVFILHSPLDMSLKIAEQNQQKSLTNSQYKIAERVTLKILKEQVNAAAKLKLISVSNQQKIVSMIDVLLSK